MCINFVHNTYLYLIFDNLDDYRLCTFLKDYEDFDMANELDKLDQFLKLNNDTFIESKPLNGTVFDTKVTNGSTTELEVCYNFILFIFLSFLMVNT